MSFLAHLAARATRQGPLLERRRPSLFEPRAGERHDMPAAAERLETAADGAWREAAPPAGTQAAATVAEMPALRPMQPRAASAMVRPDSQTAERPPAEAQDAAARPPAVRAAPLPHPFEARLALSSHDTSPPTAPDRAAASTPAVLVAPPLPAPRGSRSQAPFTQGPLPDHGVVPAPAPSPAGSAAPPQAAPPLEQHDLRSPALGTPEAPALLRPSAAGAAPLHHALQRAKAAAPHLQGATAAPPQQTVQVTIGRVEVRAVGTPERAPSRPPRAAAARLSLGEYLNDRSKGRR